MFEENCFYYCAGKALLEGVEEKIYFKDFYKYSIFFMIMNIPKTSFANFIRSEKAEEFVKITNYAMKNYEKIAERLKEEVSKGNVKINL